MSHSVLYLHRFVYVIVLVACCLVVKNSTLSMCYGYMLQQMLNKCLRFFQLPFEEDDRAARLAVPVQFRAVGSDKFVIATQGETSSVTQLFTRKNPLCA